MLQLAVIETALFRLQISDADRTSMSARGVFGEPRFNTRITLDDPITPPLPFTQEGICFDYNQFSDELRWVRANMTLCFEPQDVLYADGSREAF